MRLRPLALLFEGADAPRTRIGADHASLLAILGHKLIPMRRTAQLTFEGHRSRAVRFQRIGATQVFVLDGRLVPEGGLLAQKFASAVEIERAPPKIMLAPIAQLASFAVLLNFAIQPSLLGADRTAHQDCVRTAAPQ
jgi:hypothetical protein